MNINVKVLIGKTLTRCQREDGDGGIIYHDQDCCENVGIEDICGDLSDLVGSPILQSEENSNTIENPGNCAAKDNDESWTWTFYRIATSKGQVVIRWYGSSNGYYSESVDFTPL